MLPRPASGDGLEVGGADPETGAEVASGRTVGHQPADLQHLGFLEPGALRRLPSPPDTVPQRIVAVGPMGAPGQVLQAVVRRVAVPVAANHAGGASADERLQDEVMDVSSLLLAAPVEIDGEVAP